MITYNGNKKVGNVHYICFTNGKQNVEIPIDHKVLSQIMLYFEKLQPAEVNPVERLNDEDIEY